MPVVEQGHLRGRPGPNQVEEAGTVVVDNRTGLPDAAIMEAVQSYWVENAAFQFGAPTSFQSYTNRSGSMLARTPFTTPKDVIEEIRLARQVAETDDDVQGVLRQVNAIAFGDGMENFHSDEQTTHLFNRIARNMNLDVTLKEIMREYMIASQFTTLSLYTRQRFSFTPTGTEEQIRAQLSVPLLGVLPAEDIRILTTDIVGTGELGFEVPDGKLRDWLEEFFAKRLTPARRARYAQEQPVLAALFTERVEVPYDDPDPLIAGKVLFRLNPRMVHRTTMPKGASAYPRPTLTANFALLEAKRLLNIMDYALLQGGTNYIVVAKVGDKDKPGTQPEVDNLMDQVRSASRSGVLVGDHRINIEIITPDLKELLNPSKRKLLGRKIAMTMLGLSEQVTDDPGSEGTKSEMEIVSRVVTSDRRDIRRHIEMHVYDEVVTRNPSQFRRGAPELWFPKIVLSGTREFYDNVVKARDRGDIPRAWAVEVLGYPYEAGVAQRRREIERGDDEVLVPGNVPFDGPGGGPNDGGNGRPPGASPSNGRPGGAPGGGIDPAQRQRQLPQPFAPARAEEILSYWDEEARATRRVGALTARIVEQYPDHTVGRVTTIERESVNQHAVYRDTTVCVVPVNQDITVGEIRALRLDDGLSMIVGHRTRDNAVVAKAFCFREPVWALDSAVDTVRRWGYSVEGPGVEQEVAAQPPTVTEIVGQVLAGISAEGIAAFGQALGQALASAQSPVYIQMPGQQASRLVRDPDTGEIVGSEPVPQLPPEGGGAQS